MKTYEFSGRARFWVSNPVALATLCGLVLFTGTAFAWKDMIALSQPLVISMTGILGIAILVLLCWIKVDVSEGGAERLSINDETISFSKKSNHGWTMRWNEITSVQEYRCEPQEFRSRNWLMVLHTPKCAYSIKSTQFKEYAEIRELVRQRLNDRFIRV